MIKKDILYLKNRKMIYDFIDKYPGIYFRKIFKELKISKGTLNYHLNYLIKHDLITKNDQKGYSRFFIKNSVDSYDKKYLIHLRNIYSRSIVFFFLIYLCGSQKDICKFLNKDVKNVSIHLNRLLEAGIIEIAPTSKGKVETLFKINKIMDCNPWGREIVYRLKEPYKVLDFIITYKDKFIDEDVTIDALDFLEFIYKERKNNSAKFRSRNKDQFDIIEKFLFEMFPHPYFG